MEKTREKQIIIPEFMGRKFYAYKDNVSYEKGFDNHKECLEFINGIKEPGYEPCLGWRLGLGQYHTSWDWLMPVVEKIESLYLIVQISDKNCFIHWMGAEPDDKQLLTMLSNFKGIDMDGLNKIDAVYTAAIAFITYYNQHKTV